MFLQQEWKLTPWLAHGTCKNFILNLCFHSFCFSENFHFKCGFVHDGSVLEGLWRSFQELLIYAIYAGIYSQESTKNWSNILKENNTEWTHAGRPLMFLRETGQTGSGRWSYHFLHPPYSFSTRCLMRLTSSPAWKAKLLIQSLRGERDIILCWVPIRIGLYCELFFKYKIIPVLEGCYILNNFLMS